MFDTFNDSDDKLETLCLRKPIYYTIAQLLNRLSLDYWRFLVIIHNRGLKVSTSACRLPLAKSLICSLVHNQLERPVHPNISVHEHQYTQTISALWKNERNSLFVLFYTTNDVFPCPLMSKQNISIFFVSYQASIHLSFCIILY